MSERKKDTIKLCDLSTGYKDKIVTSNINAILRSGELTCLLGPNGAGKSTLLKTLCAFIPPVQGKILIDGHDVTRLSAKTLAQTIGVVLTERPSAMNMNVEELVAIGRSPYTSFWGRLSVEDQEIVDEAIRLVGIDSLRHRSVATLSDGERQKALIAKALAQQTGIVFLDEPTAFLDYPSKVEIMKLLYRIARAEDKTIFMSTHDIELALQIADKIWLLDKSRGLQIGVPEDLACQGYLADYFENEFLKFNHMLGTFEILHDHIGNVRLIGSGQLCQMVKKALHRIGFDTDSTDPAAHQIEILTATDYVDTILLDGSPVSCIESLLHLLTK